MRFLKLLLLGLVLLAAAYFAGYWRESRRSAALEAEKAPLQQQLQAAEAKVRAAQLLGELLTLKETVQEMNYGQARGLSSPFFDHVRAELARTTDPGVRQALEAIQALRDPVTVALTQGDSVALNHLRDAERRLRAALGYPAPAATAVPSAAPSMLPGPLTPASPGAPGSVAPPASPAAPSNPLGLPTPSPTI